MFDNFLTEDITDEDIFETKQNRTFYYIIELYADLALRMKRHGNAVYVSPDCPDVLGAHQYMYRDVELIEKLMREAGVKVVSGRKHWESIRQFCPLEYGSTETAASLIHGESDPAGRRLLARWDWFLKRVIHWAIISHPDDLRAEWIDKANYSSNDELSFRDHWKEMDTWSRTECTSIGSCPHLHDYIESAQDERAVLFDTKVSPAAKKGRRQGEADVHSR